MKKTKTWAERAAELKKKREEQLLLQFHFEHVDSAAQAWEGIAIDLWSCNDCGAIVVDGDSMEKHFMWHRAGK